MKTPEGAEVIKGELMCPNPRKTYQMTRSYESMRLEHDLLNAHKFTDDDLEFIAYVRQMQNAKPLWQYMLWIYSIGLLGLAIGVCIVHFRLL